MRLWHYLLIPVLPRQQLLGQWRECCLIAKNIAEEGSPNHILVNPVTDYGEWDFMQYCKLVYGEMLERGYRADPSHLLSHLSYGRKTDWDFLPCHILENIKLFENWHNDRYLDQCYKNLEEKYDRGGITEYEWAKIMTVYDMLTRKEEK